MALRKVIWKFIAGILLNFSFLLVGIQSVYAQAPFNLDIAGTVSSQNDRSKMSGVTVTVLKNGSRADQFTTDSKGKFQYLLSQDAKYLLEFSYPGYVTKRISFNVKMVPPEFAEMGDLDFPFDMTLFKEMPGLDVSVLDKPLADVAYDPSIGTFGYDKEYTKSVKTQIEKLQADLEAQLAAQEAAAKENEKSYQKAIADGGKAMSSGDFAAAKVSFAAALALKPNDQNAQSKLEDAQKKYDKDRAEKDTEKAYKTAIENAEMALHEKDYKKAEAEFQNAMSAKPGDIYARDQLKEIRDMMVSEAKAEQTYITAIGKADAALQVKDYLTAKAEYVKASEAKPEDKYAKDQLSHVEGLLVADAKKESEYIKAIERGESSFEAKDYEAAKAAFEQAGTIKPEEKYPKDQLTKISGILAEIALQAKNYQEFIKKGDEAFAKNDFPNAKIAYEKAIEINPVQQYPKDQIAAINKKVEEMAKLEAQYTELIKDADQRYDSKDYIASKSQYVKALAIRPAETHPKTRIDEIAAILEKEAKIEEDYKSAISNADNAFKSKDYNSAKFEYEAASKLKPEEAYPKDQLGKIAGFLAEMAKKEEDYKAAIAEADAKFKGAEYESAKLSYTSASALKPEELYPKDQIKAIDAKVLELANLNKQYDAAIVAADKLFDSEKLAEAKTSYEKALEIKPTESYPKERIAAITASLAEAQKKDADYQAFIAQGDQAFGKKDYEAAKTAFTSASELKINEKYPKDKLAEIDGLIKQLADQQKSYDDAIAKADAAFNKNELEAALPLYQAAAGIKEGESYPIKQIELIDGKLGDLKKQNEAYASAITKAESAEKAGDLNGSLAEFKNASSIKPEEAYPKEKITSLTALIAENEKKNASYNEAIALADEAKKSASYDIALTQYKKASELKPTEEYPKAQLKEVEALKTASLAAIALAKKQEDDYKALVSEADALFDELQFEDSKKKYQASLDIKPTEQYPKTRIVEIDNKLAGLMAEQEKNTKYTALISSADKAFTSKDWTVAKSNYSEAKAIKPEESYPTEKIAAIEAAIAAETAAASQKEKDDKYAALITAGDKSFSSKEWSTAKSNYEQAKSIKPEESYPVDQLKAIDVAIAEAAALAAQQQKEAADKERDEKYKGHLAVADQAFKSKDWATAKSGYEEAKAVKPEESYPIEQLKAITAAIAAAEALASQQEKEALAKAKEEKYNAFIANADRAFNSKEWNTAISNYDQAKLIKPEESYPINQLKAIDAAMAEERLMASQKESEAAEKAKNDKYNFLITSADQAFKSKDWDDARANYNEAKSVKPAETYPDEQLKAITAAIAAADAMASQQQKEAAEREKEANYLALISAADKSFATKQWENSRGNYQEALKIKPQESYPKDQLKLIDGEIAAQNEGEKKKQYDAFVSTADRAFKSKDWSSAKTNYQSALSVLPNEQYPKDQMIRIDESEAKANDIALESKQNEDYRQLIGDADQLFNNKDWQASKSKYQEALGIKPSEVHPKNQIVEIDKNLALLSEASKKDSEYQNLISQGDAGFNKKDYSSARSSYSKALAIKNETYPKSKIDEIDKLIEAENSALSANKQAEAEKQKKYDNLIKEGDKNFSSKNYAPAKSNYQAAIDVKPNESYPKNKINEINDILGKQQVAVAKPVAKKSSGMSDAEIAAMMAKWQQERNQSKTDRLNQTQVELKETAEERNQNSEERRKNANGELDDLEQTLASSNKAGENRNLEEAELVEAFRKDEQSQRHNQNKDAEQNRNGIYDNIEKKEVGQKEMKEKGNELYKVNTEKTITEKIELIQDQQKRSKDAHNGLLVAHEGIVDLEVGLKEDRDNAKDHHLNEVERIEKDNSLVLSTVRTWKDDSRESRSESYEEISQLEKNIHEFKTDNAESYMVNTETYNKNSSEISEYRDRKNKEANSQRTKAYNNITDYQDDVADITKERHNQYDMNNEAIRNENQAIINQQATLSAQADERRKRFDRNFYTGEKKPRYPELAREYSQGVTEESFEEDDAYVVKRIVVTGENIDEYQKVFYKWGGVYYKKNGRNITEVIWNTETK